MELAETPLLEVKTSFQAHDNDPDSDTEDPTAYRQTVNELEAREESIDVPRDWKAVALLYVVLIVALLTVFLITEGTQTEAWENNFCGDGGLVIFRNSYISNCFRQIVIFLPVLFVVFIYGFFYMLLERPWKVSIEVITSGRIIRPAKFIANFWLKIGVSSVVLLCYIIEASAYAGRLWFYNNQPVVVALSVVLASLAWIFVIITISLNYHSGDGHPFFIRLFFFGELVHSLTSIFEEVDTPVALVLDFVVAACTLLLCILVYAGWKQPSIEDLGFHEIKRKIRKLPKGAHIRALIKPFRSFLYFGFFLSFIQAIAYNMSIILSANLMGGEITNADEAGSAALVFLGLSATVAFLRMICQAIYGLTGQRVNRHLKKIMFRNFLLQDATFLHKKENETGTLTARLNNDAEQFGKALTVQLSDICKPFFQSMVGMALLLALSWRLAAVLICMLIVLFSIMVARSILVTAKFSRMYSDTLAVLSARGLEVLKGIECVHQYQQEQNEYQKFGVHLDNVYDVARTKEIQESLFEGLENFLLACITAVTLWYGTILVINGDMEASTLLSFSLIAGTTIAGIEDINKCIPGFLDAAGPALRVCELINTPVAWDWDQVDEGLIPEALNGKLEFKDVCFRYPGSPADSKSILGPGLSFTIEQGESAAFIGESGCGKSTTVSLVSRDYHVQGLPGFQGTLPHPKDAGHVYLDGVDIRSLNRSWLLQQIGIVAQQSVIFNTSIRENVAYGRADERGWSPEEVVRNGQEARIIAALRDAAAFDEFISREKENGLGLDFVCGQDGCNLSGGQKQRVSIARMIYKEPSMFIFDEVTSALDANSERKVMDTLTRISKNKTSLLVAHRLNTIKHVNNIVVLRKGGTIIEKGHHFNQTVEEQKQQDEPQSTAHDQLIAADGIYKQMFTDQSF